jgi:hypothetical protein
MRRAFLAMLALLCPLCRSFAQFDVESARKNVIIKYSPLPMLDFDNTIQFGVEIPLGKGDFSVQEDLGFGHSSFNIWYHEENEVPDKQTFKSRTHLRWYFVERRRMRAYVGPEFLYKKVVYREEQWVGRDCAGGRGGPCSFFENREVRVDKNVGAVHARFGWQFIFPSRLTLDVFSGLGFRSVVNKSRTPSIPDSEIRSIYDHWQSVGPSERDILPSLVLGIHLGIVLGKYKD